MDSTVKYNFLVDIGNSSAELKAMLTGIVNVDEAATKHKKTVDDFGRAALNFAAINQSIRDLGSAWNALREPGMAFNSEMKELQAITKVNDGQMAAISDLAREQAVAFGTDAAQGVNNYKLLLSQLSPELAKYPRELASMGESVTVLSKQMGNDGKAAAEVLTTAMNQYGVSMENPAEATRKMAEMMNVMSAAAQEGSAELPSIKSALEEAGMMANTSNVTFSELNAAVQVLDKAGKKGSEGGIAIRNVLAELAQGKNQPLEARMALEKYGIEVDKLNDKNLTMSQRLAALKPMLQDESAMISIFGKENVAAAIALVQNTDEITRLEGAIGGTNSAYNMATTIMGSAEEKQARQVAFLNDLKISFFEATDAVAPYLFGLGKVAAAATQLYGGYELLKSSGITGWIMNNTKMLAQNSLAFLRNAAIMAGSAFAAIGTFIGSIITATTAQLGLNIAMTANPIGLIVVGIAAAITAIALLVRNWDTIKVALVNFGKWIWDHHPFKWMLDLTDKVFPGFKKAMAELWDWAKEKFQQLFGWIGDAWGGIKRLFGGGDAPVLGGQGAGSIAGNARALANNLIGKPAAEGAFMLMDEKRQQGASASALNSKLGGAGSTPKVKEATDRITSSTVKPTNIYITLGKLQDQIVINASSVTEGAKDMERLVTEALMKVLNSANALT